MAAPRIQIEGAIGPPARHALAAVEKRLPTVTGLVIELRQATGKAESFTIAKSAPGVVRVTGGDAVGLSASNCYLLTASGREPRQQ